MFHWVDADGRVAGTLQIGRPAWIAERTGLPVVSDLRSADVAAGGQGAPLVALFDVLLLGGTAASVAPRVALNLGGIANLTVVPAAAGSRPPGPGPAPAPFAYDAGPANALLDAAAVALTGAAETCDRGGDRAARGTVDDELLAVLLEDPFLAQPPPKT